MFKLPTVKSAFCGCTPAEGSKIIAYIHLILYAIMLGAAVFFSFEHESDPESWNDDLSSNATNSTNGTMLKDVDTLYMEKKLIEEGFLALTSSYFNDMVFLVQVVFAVSLLIGIYMKNLDLIFSWILLQIINVFFSQTLVTVYFFAFFNAVVHHAMLYLVFEEITLGIIEAYFIVVVNSYMKELTEINEDNQEVLSPIVINSSSVDLRYPEEANNFVH